MAIDQLVARVGEPDAVRSQAQFLQRWGIDELVDGGPPSCGPRRRRAPGWPRCGMRSRVREAEALLDPDGLGAFTVLEWVAP